MTTSQMKNEINTFSIMKSDKNEKEKFLSSNKLDSIYLFDCTKDLSDIKAKGYYAPNMYEAFSLLSFSGKYGYELHLSSKFEANFFQHLHPINDDGKRSSIHIWYGAEIYNK